MGCDFNVSIASNIFNYFNPRTHRGVRQRHEQTYKSLKISIHAPIVGCDGAKVILAYHSYISIHAPIVGCDQGVGFLNSSHLIISIHAPIVGCDKIAEHSHCIKTLFQSTHPSWGATAVSFSVSVSSFNFNPRTHRGVRPSFMYP